MTFVYESSLSKEFLKMTLNYLKSALEDILREDRSFDAGTFPKEVLPRLHRNVLGPIFPDDMRRVEEAVWRIVNEVVSEVSEYKRRVIGALLRMLNEVQEGNKGSSIFEAYSESSVQPFYRTLKALARMQAEMADAFSNSSFLAAFLVASTLERKIPLSNTGEPKIIIKVKDEEVPIISTWSSLVKKRACLLCTPTLTDSSVEELCRALESMGKELSKREVIMDIRDDMATYIRSREVPSRLSRITYNAMFSLKDEGLKKLLCGYVINHLCALSEHLIRLSSDIRNEDVEAYLNKVFIQRAFLEYEVYSALIQQSVAAIPRLHLLIYDSEFKTKKFDQEVDVVATADDEVWLIEVTSRKDEKEIEEKVEKYEKLRYEIDADKVVFVCLPSLKELVEKNLESSLAREDFYCIRIDKLYGEIFRLLASKSRR
jgi:hypothetical protein